MDYCNYLHYGVGARALMCLQKIQNAAARTVKSGYAVTNVIKVVAGMAQNNL